MWVKQDWLQLILVEVDDGGLRSTRTTSILSVLVHA